MVTTHPLKLLLKLKAQGAFEANWLVHLLLIQDFRDSNPWLRRADVTCILSYSLELGSGCDGRRLNGLSNHNIPRC